jgi:superfamily II DNA or RNA helicase
VSKREYQSFEEAKKFLRSLDLKNQKEWQKYCKSGKKPDNIPYHPDRAYKDQWKGFGDWLGTGTIATQDRIFLSFDEARQFIRSLGLKNQQEWRKYLKSGKKPDNIPSEPAQVYKDQWKGFGDWLGTGTIATQDRIFLSFDEARQFIHSLSLKNQKKWQKYRKSGKKPDNIPSNPNNIYQNQWKGWPDWFGYEEKNWSVKKVKQLLNSLIESKIIFSEDGAFLLSFLGRNQVLNLENNRHSAFFKSLAYAAQTNDGLKQILEYANNNSEIPPRFTDFETGDSEVSFEEAKTILDKKLEETDIESIEISEKRNPLSNPNTVDSKTILGNTMIFESTSLDDEAMEFYVNYFVHKLWKDAFQNEIKALSDVKSKETKNKFTKKVITKFLSEYYGTTKLKIPKNKFGREPFLMQRYCAYKILKEPYLANFSGTGSGKTFSAILSSRVIDSKMTLIICPNHVVEQWENRIHESYPDSVVVVGKKAFYEKRENLKFKYLVVNWDKLNQPESYDYIMELKNQKIDLIILDEIHFSKNTDTKRTERLKAILTYAKRKNKLVKILGMTATPIVNNLLEGKVILELITGKRFDDLKVTPFPPNAVALYEKFTNIGIRHLPNYDKARLHYWDVDAPIPDEKIARHMPGNPLAIEQYLTDYRLPEIIKHIDGQTIIYTDYVGDVLPEHDDIITKITKAVEKAGHTFGYYTGERTDGLEKFKKRQVNVLIASRPISVGIDDLQYVCNNLIFNALPWTNAQYRQIIGRIERSGQTSDVVNIHHIRVNVSGFHYDRDRKIQRINDKKTLADCAVDGTLPDHILVTPEQAAKEAAKWLLRLSRGEISVVTRQEWEVELSPSEQKRREVKYGDFTKMNQVFYTTHSSKLHQRLLKNKEEWIQYHKLQEYAEKSWSVIPRDEIINRLKKLSRHYYIGDFGCGRESFIQNELGRRVKSFDHVAREDITKVKSCDMSNVSEYVKDGELDVAVFCLSLMGSNWQEYIKEAARCVIKHGLILIAEPTRRVKEKLDLQDVLFKNQFEIIDQGEIGDFTFIEARKII